MNKILIDYCIKRRQHDLSLETLENEVSRIVNVIKSVFKIKNAWWSFAYYRDGDDEPPLPNISTKMEVEGFPIYISEDAITAEWYYHESFPIQFFDMTDVEIKEYLEKEISNFKEKERERKEKEKQKLDEKNLEREKVKKSAINKLTKAERKVLGL